MIGTYHPSQNTSGVTTPEAPTAEEIQGIVSQVATEAKAFITEEIDPKRVEAIDYYFGRPFGNEEDGRSKVISTDVRDGIQAMLPGLIRTFCGSERAMEARPRGPEDERKAEEQTEFANLVFFHDNDGFRIVHDFAINGLREGLGTIKVWWEEGPKATTLQYTGLSSEDLIGLEDDPQVELSQVEEDTGSTPEEPIYRAMVTRVEDEGRIRVEAAPPEEVIFNRTARSRDESLIFGQCSEMMVSDVIKLGYTQEQIEDAIGADEVDDQVQQARNPSDFGTGGDEGMQFALRRILYSELFMMLDVEGKGRADLFKVCTVGGNFKVLHLEPAADRPFATFVPLPEPHTILGQSWADLLMDTQKVKSAIRRGMLDSLNLTLHPRQVILDGAVEIDDVFNTEIGGVIRERVLNATRIQEHRFVGADAMVMMEYEDQGAEQRTGRTKGAQGLNADSLQSATKMAVSATVSAAHQRAELVAYIMADSLKDVFKLILKVARQHQQKARIVKLRGEYVPVDPRNWDTELDFEVAVGLGSGMVEERKAALQEILQGQMTAMTQMGPSNQLTSLGRVRNTLAKLTKLAGYPDADQFWRQVDDDAIDKAAAEAAKDPNANKAPEDKLAEAQMQMQQLKSQTDLQVAQMNQQAKAAELEIRKMEIALKQQEGDKQLELDKQKMLLDFELKKAEIEARFAADIQMQRVKSEFEQQRLIAETAVEREKARINAEAQKHAAEVKAQASASGRKLKVTRNPETGQLDSAEISTG